MRSTFQLLSTTALVASLAAACNSVQDVTLTFYGYPDNSPPGPAVAHNCGGRNYVAGGTGTYTDPITVATAPGELNVCEMIYIPYLKKYGRYEDDCAQCETDWSNGIWHVDIWTGSPTYNGKNSQIQCEDDLTPNAQAIIRDPSNKYEVDTTALYNKGNCATSHTFNNNPTKNYCSH